jgi:hypothetical protein
MDWIISVVLGIGLAAACGFRVFVPLFIVSLFSHFDIGGLGVNESFEWLGSMPAVLTFGAASLVELFAYYIPYVDNLLDTLAIPLAAVAGTMISLSTMVELDPLIQWSIALIAGGGLAGLVKGTSAATRLVSTTTTGGLGNPVVSTAETGASVFMTVLAWFIPLLALLFIFILLFFAFRFFFRRKTG